jgi:uncharacterized RmlC-like cupin family protein
MAEPRITTVPGDGLQAAAPTPGLIREIAAETAGATLMRARAEPKAASGWHHHGGRDVFGYVVKGAARFEYGVGGREKVQVGEGGFFHVPAGLIHRDVNPLSLHQEIVLTVVGSGPLVVNVDGPESGEQ